MYSRYDRCDIVSSTLAVLCFRLNLHLLSPLSPLSPLFLQDVQNLSNPKASNPAILLLIINKPLLILAFLLVIYLKFASTLRSRLSLNLNTASMPLFDFILQIFEVSRITSSATIDNPQLGGKVEQQLVAQILHLLLSIMRYISKHLRNFATKKQTTIRSIFTHQQIEKVSSFNDGELQQLLNASRQQKDKWSKLGQNQKRKIMDNFYAKMSAPENVKWMGQMCSSLTGRDCQSAERQLSISLKVMKNHLDAKLELAVDKQGGYYQLVPFEHAVSIFDNRNPFFSSMKYMGLCLRTGSPLILRPNIQVYPLISRMKQLFSQSSPTKMVHCLADPFSPLSPNSPTTNILKTSQVFVSFSGRMQQGFDFNHYMTFTSDSLMESEYLLTSSDSAYVMKDLGQEQLKKVCGVVARASFSNCGVSFNSVKRVFVDREIADALMDCFVEEAKKYKICSQILGDEGATLNKGNLSPIDASHLQQSLSKLQTLTNNPTQFQPILKHQHKSLNKMNFLTPSIFKLNTSFPDFQYQNEQYLFPICLIEVVDSVEECIEKINSSIFGVSCSLFSGKIKEEEVVRIGQKLEVGTVNVNCWDVCEGVTYSARKRSGRGFSFSPLSLNNLVRTKAVSY